MSFYQVTKGADCIFDTAEKDEGSMYNLELTRMPGLIVLPSMMEIYESVGAFVKESMVASWQFTCVIYYRLCSVTRLYHVATLMMPVLEVLFAFLQWLHKCKV